VKGALGRPAEGCDNAKRGVEVLVAGELDISDYAGQGCQRRIGFRVLTH
jgi:hypothetical protein